MTKRGSMEAFALWLETQIDDAGGQRAAAKAWGIDASQLSRIINGHTQRLSTKTFHKLAEGMGLPAWQLMEIAGVIEPERDAMRRLMTPDQLAYFESQSEEEQRRIVDTIIDLLRRR